MIRNGESFVVYNRRKFEEQEVKDRTIDTTHEISADKSAIEFLDEKKSGCN